MFCETVDSNPQIIVVIWKKNIVMFDIVHVAQPCVTVNGGELCSPQLHPLTPLWSPLSPKIKMMIRMVALKC